MTERPVGISDLSVATTHYRLEHTVLAQHLGTDAAKFHQGLGQEAMSIPAIDEDIVTMATTAAQPIVARHGTEGIQTILFATETGIDQSKAAGLYTHRLLEMPHTCRIVELKQACYSATAALQFAAALVVRDPAQKVLVIASDIARYELGSSAEATQGAGAVAMLVTADPVIWRLDPFSGVYSSDVMDFWRPNYREEPVVDGRLSIEAYQRATQAAWNDYRHHGGRDLTEFAAFCYHQPFTKMAYKAHHHLLESAHVTPAGDSETVLAASTIYNRSLGNCYTASAYIALASLLDHRTDLADRPVALISYGSGSVAEFLSGIIQPGYRDHLRTTDNANAITQRRPLDYQRYRELHGTTLPTDGARHEIGHQTRAPYRLAALDNHKRIYQAAKHNRDQEPGKNR
jgi:hydroxymethylglutaryl-CoA synthase